MKSRERVLRVVAKNNLKTSAIVFALAPLTYLFQRFVEDTSHIGELRDKMLIFLMLIELGVGAIFLLLGVIRWIEVSNLAKKRQKVARKVENPPPPPPPEPVVRKTEEREVPTPKQTKDLTRTPVTESFIEGEGFILIDR